MRKAKDYKELPVPQLKHSYLDTDYSMVTLRIPFARSIVIPPIPKTAKKIPEIKNLISEAWTQYAILHIPLEHTSLKRCPYRPRSYVPKIHEGLTSANASNAQMLSVMKRISKTKQSYALSIKIAEPISAKFHA